MNMKNVEAYVNVISEVSGIGYRQVKLFSLLGYRGGTERGLRRLEALVERNTGNDL